MLLSNAVIAGTLAAEIAAANAQVTQLNTGISDSATITAGTFHIIDPVNNAQLDFVIKQPLTGDETATMLNAMLTVLNARLTTWQAQLAAM